MPILGQAPEMNKSAIMDGKGTIIYDLHAQSHIETSWFHIKKALGKKRKENGGEVVRRV